MRLYAGHSPDFIRDATRNQIADRLKNAFFSYYRYNPSPNEVNSWRNSLRAIKDVLVIAGLNDHGILLEYQLPLSSKRIDCMVCGRDDLSRDRAVIVELKQWERCEPAEPEKLVRSWVGGRNREILHPSVQVGQYRDYLEDSHSAFHEEPAPIQLSACSYLHNYTLTADDPLRDPKFSDAITRNPIFDIDGADALAEHLKTQLVRGEGTPVLKRVESSSFRLSRKLMDNVSAAISSPRFVPAPVEPPLSGRFVTALPLIPLEAAASAFGSPQYFDETVHDWVTVQIDRPLRKGMFVSRVIGKSMEPKIPDGSYCVFASPVVGTRHGKIVLVRLLNETDAETGHRYTVKRYESHKSHVDDTWQHNSITLNPINPAFPPILINENPDDRLEVLAELIEVL